MRLTDATIFKKCIFYIYFNFKGYQTTQEMGFKKIFKKNLTLNV
jgi:hypothetical protein